MNEKNTLSEINEINAEGHITRRCISCGKPLVRFKIVRDIEKSCIFVDLELKSKCGEDNRVRIRV